MEGEEICELKASRDFSVECVIAMQCVADDILQQTRASAFERADGRTDDRSNDVKEKESSRRRYYYFHSFMYT